MGIQKLGFFIEKSGRFDLVYPSYFEMIENTLNCIFLYIILSIRDKKDIGGHAVSQQCFKMESDVIVKTHMYFVRCQSVSAEITSGLLAA